MDIALGMLGSILLAMVAVGDAATSEQISSDKAALAPLQAYVGSWRGVGQPRRGSNQGAWTEKSEWLWNFADGRAALVLEAADGKYFASGKLLPGKGEGTFELTLRRRDTSEESQFFGRIDKNGQLVLLSKSDAAPDEPARITIRLVADDDRMLVLYEKRLPGDDRFARLAEVGYTRRDASFAKGSGEPECVVTGGLGTIEVSYQGKKYFVCCTGCRDLFNDDAEGVLADYRDRKAAEREKSKRPAPAK